MFVGCAKTAEVIRASDIVGEVPDGRIATRRHVHDREHVGEIRSFQAFLAKLFSDRSSPELHLGLDRSSLVSKQSK